MANKFKQFLFDTLGIETKEEKERQELLKNEGEIALMPEQAPTSDEKKEEKEKEWADVNQDYEYVCQGGTVMCKYHSAGDAKLMPTSTEVMLQDKPYVTEADTDGKTNFVFTGLCTHSSHGSKKPPCKAVINLIKWKNCSTSHIDDYHPILFKSSIPCMISGEDLKVTNSGQVNRPDDLSIYPSNIKVRIQKIDTEYFTPLGIQNPIKKDIKTDGSIKLVYEIEEEDAIRVYISVADRNGDTIFSEVFLPGIIVVRSKSKTSNNTIENEVEECIPSEFLTQGTYVWEWDGFDADRKLDTSRLLDKLTFEVRAYSQDGLTVVTSTHTVKVEPIVSKARWVKALITNQETSKYSDIDPDADPIINITREIDISFNVNLKDGGTKGIDSKDPIIIMGSSPLPNSPFPTVPVASYTPGDWDKIPKEEIVKAGKDPIKTRVTSFEDLVNLALDGVKTYWSRNGTRDNGITVDGMNFIVNTEAINTDKKSPYSLDDIPLIFNTNRDWGRSGNPGCWGGIISTGTKTVDSGLNLLDVHIQQITYNIGYIEYPFGWRYHNIKDANDQFQFTSAHELGHEILQTFGGDIYSYQHKGSSYLTQSPKPVTDDKQLSDYAIAIGATILTGIGYSGYIWAQDQMKDVKGEYYPKVGEQDLMKYYSQELTPDGQYALSGSEEDLLRIVAAEEDVKGLIWITSIKIIK